MNKDLTKKQVRENVINFFGNDNLTTNHKTIENAIQNIETMEKGFKRKLKLLIASEEYEKYKEIPPKDNTRRCKPLVPPQSFESPHVYRKDSILNKFKCKDCHQEFTPEENAMKHMKDDKLRTNASLEKMDDKVKKQTCTWWLDNSNPSHCICEIEKLIINIHIDIPKMYIPRVCSRPAVCLQCTFSLHRVVTEF